MKSGNFPLYYQQKTILIGSGWKSLPVVPHLEAMLVGGGVRVLMLLEQRNINLNFHSFTV